MQYCSGMLTTRSLCLDATGWGLCRANEATRSAEACQEGDALSCPQCVTAADAACVHVVRKQAYRSAYEKLKEGKAEVRYLSKGVDTLKANVLTTFEEWCADNVTGGGVVAAAAAASPSLGSSSTNAVPTTLSLEGDE